MEPLARSESLQAGQSLGKFYLVRLIGEGGTSRIFKALQQPINRTVALKIPSFADAGSVLSPDEFLSEATLMARLDHPNVVRIHDFGVHEDHAFICMEYVEGWNLADLVESRGALPHASVLAIGMQTLEALTHAHGQEVLHLDLSPANVLISRRGTVKLSDFGMAGKRTGFSGGRIIGTPAFLSPEHVAGTPCTKRSDIFSFGSLLYYAARGEPLFDPGPGNSRVTQSLREIEAARSRPPEDRLRALPSPLGRIVASALEGSEAAGLADGLRDAWRDACGEALPGEMLVRELGLDGDPLGARPVEPLPEGNALRERYRNLREQGRHREAVDLLEKALRREPDSPVLRELLAQPPASRKSGAATVEVGTGATPAPVSAGGARRRARLVWAAGGLALTFTLLAGVRAWRESPSAPSITRPAIAGTIPALIPGRGQADGGRFGTAETPSRAAAVPTPLTTDPPHPVSSHPAAAASVAPGPASDASTSAARVSATPAFARPASEHPGASELETLDAAASVRGAKPVRSAGARRPRMPALALAAPAGTRVSVDDTAEWLAPGPKSGWPLAPGLVNITLTPPGRARPITSSLFVSADTLYVLNLDDEGGFSVIRRRR